MKCLSLLRSTIAARLLSGLVPLPALHAADDVPIVGANRWDAWYGDGSVTKAVEASPGQLKYHFRLPWFARVVSERKVGINGDLQTIMEQEIAYAAQAGRNYWAFLEYLDEAPGMSISLNRYLAAKDKKGIRYCLVEEGARLDKVVTKAWSKIVERFQHPDFQTGLEGRPLLCLLARIAKVGRVKWDEWKRQTIAAGLKAPYLVRMGWKAQNDRRVGVFTNQPSP